MRKNPMPVLMIAYLFSLLIVNGAVSVAAPNILLTDLTGTPVSRLPYLNRGDTRLIPLAMLAKSAGFEITNHRGKERINSAGCETVLEVRNSFAEVNGAFVQLIAPAESWDGSLWIPLPNLDELFPTTIELSETGEVIRLLGIADSASGVIIPIEVGPLSGTQRSWQFGKVILDAGHGGKDPGGKGLQGYTEKDIVLDIARRTELALTGMGVPVVLTRRADEFLTLGQRTRMANAESGDLFISIHCNSYKDPTIGGAECYILKPARTERAIEVAAKENQVIELERGVERYEELPEENHILLSMATSQYLRDSERWSEVLLEELSVKTKLRSRGVDQAGFYVLMGASMPAILLECGYLSNPEDMLVLGTERGRQLIAEAIAASVLRMKTEMESASR
ncbi:N-acetylmuramoyl-L-alanine amidase [bacterium]|nr:N-acetylmuramoyl-L-alanine amidase [bacterium]